MNSSSSGSASTHVETTTSLLQTSFSRRISSNKHAISGGAPTCVTIFVKNSYEQLHPSKIKIIIVVKQNKEIYKE